MNNRFFSSAYCDCIGLFLKIKRAELTDKGFRAVNNHLSSFDSFLSSEKISGTISVDVVNSWIRSLKQLANGTINNYIGDIRQFLIFTNKATGSHHYIPVYRHEEDTYMPHYFDNSEIEKIYSVVDDYPSHWNNHLPWIKAELPMLLRIMEGCGTRITEVLLLKMKDVDLHCNALILRRTKNEKQRIVPMSNSLSIILEQYCKAMCIVDDPDAFLFPGRTRKTHLEHKDIESRINHSFDWAGIDRSNRINGRGPCLYNFRHSFAIRSFKKLEQQGIHIDDVIPYLSIYMGHENLNETQKYLKFSPELFPEEIEKFDTTAAEIIPTEDLWEKWAL